MSKLVSNCISCYHVFSFVFVYYCCRFVLLVLAMFFCSRLFFQLTGLGSKTYGSFGKNVGLQHISYIRMNKVQGLGVWVAAVFRGPFLGKPRALQSDHI